MQEPRLEEFESKGVLPETPNQVKNMGLSIIQVLVGANTESQTTLCSRVEVCSSFSTITVLEESQVTPQGSHR